MDMSGAPALAPAIEAEQARPGFAPLLLGCWLFGCAILIAVNWHDIATLAYPDPDDQLRLVEVRDWLGGQSWWDVSQHRMNPPLGGLMHWSRLVDLPIAGFELLLRPLLGAQDAQAAAAVIVPMVTLGFCMAMVALLVRRLIGREAAILAALLTAASPGALQQMRPLRVDHHGWQIGLAIAVMVALLDRRPLRAGAVAGAVLAVWLRISLEGLPLAAAAGALVGLRWALCPTRGEDGRLVAFFATLAGGSSLLFAAFIPRAEWPLAWCDSISAPQLAMFAAAATGSVALRLLPPRRVPRLCGGALLALGCLAVLHGFAPRCGLDAFADMAPIVRTVWYDNVLEGLPLWQQSATIAALAIGYPVVGLVGGLLAWRAARGEARTLWRDYLFILAATMAATVLVQRIGGTANMLALPGGVWLMTAALRRARAIARLPLRLLATAGAVLLLAPVTPALAITMLVPGNTSASNTADSAGLCAGTADFRALRVVPPSRFLAPLDLGPGILLNTGSSVVASGYHRNDAAIADVIRAYAGSPDAAHAIVARRGIGYVALCRHANEVAVYRHYGPHGFAAALSDGHAPAWLRPVPLVDGGRMRLWRVIG